MLVLSWGEGSRIPAEIWPWSTFFMDAIFERPQLFLVNLIYGKQKALLKIIYAFVLLFESPVTTQWHSLYLALLKWHIGPVNTLFVSSVTQAFQKSPKLLHSEKRWYSLCVLLRRRLANLMMMETASDYHWLVPKRKVEDIPMTITSKKWTYADHITGWIGKRTTTQVT